MDYDSDSSDFHFPSDTGLARLSSPLSAKVPESRDWALEEFMRTLSTQPCMESDNLTSFKQYIPVKQCNDDVNYGPPKLTLPTYEEKDFLTQISQHFIDLERKELHDILKGGFSLVQNDIQENAGASPFASAHHGITWFDEALDHGRNQHNSICTIDNLELKNDTSKLNQQPYYHSNLSGNSLTEEKYISLPMLPEIVLPKLSKPLLPNHIETDSTVLPDVNNNKCPTENSRADNKKSKGLKSKLKSKLIKTFTPSTNNNKKSFLQNTKKFITRIFPIKTTTSTKNQ